MTSKFALVIANTEYQDASFAKLTAPGKDAEEFARVLLELAAFDDVQVLLNEGEGKTRRSIARFFAERKRDDLLLLYFSGHGVRNEVGHLYLAANDTEINILEASGIPAEFVTQSMNNSRSQRQLLILDCCNSGAFAHGSKSASGVGKSMGIATAFEGSGFGRVVLTATDATQYAWEGDKVIGETQKSVFTHFLIEGLKGDADLDSDGRIDVDELYDYAYEEVVRRTPKQTPGKWSYKQQGDIILRDNLKPREIKPAPLPPELLEMLAHPNSGVRRAGLQELIGLLDSKHQGLARAAREKLREIAENDDSLTLRRSVSDVLKARGFVLEQVIEPGDFYSFQQGPVPDSIETPKVEHKAQKHALTTEGRVEVLREKPAGALLNWKSIVSRFNLRVLLGIGALLVVASLAVAAFPALRNLFAPGVGSTTIGKDGATLVYVPAGEFTMGTDADDALAGCQKFRSDCQRSWFTNEEPPHTVNLDAFWIDQTEVTVQMYYLCVEAGVCKQPTSKGSYTHSSYYGNAEYDNYPVIYVDWNMAKTYCEWVDRRLPTEAEWEKAARGENALIYPWGNDAPNNNLLNHNDSVGDTTEVGKYPNGVSPYGALDMAGNVWEWVEDWYGDTYYASAPASNPLGPDSGQSRVLRGGSWYGYGRIVRSALRLGDHPSVTNVDIGFRCARSADEQAESTQLAQAATTTPSSPPTTQPTKTDTPSPTETSISPTPTRGIGSIMIGKDGMTLLYVSAGEFMMGSDNRNKDQRPVHKVNLNAFWIDQTEVTNKMYALCVSAQACKEPANKSSYTQLSYYGNSEFDNYPVIYVSWNDAKAYCEWAGRELPTEAEWEKAARGTDGNIYPWGNAEPNNNLLNYGNFGLNEVGKYPNGKSPYGALDMAGNASEWVNDWYDVYPGGDPNVSGDFGQIYRVLRGGASGNYIGYSVRSADRYWSDPTWIDYSNGFRCAMSATP